MHALSACYVKALKWASNTWSPASEVSPQTQRTEKAVICWIYLQLRGKFSELLQY